MNYFWIIAFSLLIAIILLPLERKGYLNRTLLITGSLISAGINGICVIILGLGTDDGVLSVKTLIIYFVLNFIIAFCLRKQVPQVLLAITKQKVLKWLIFLTPLFCFFFMELVFSGFSIFSAMEFQYRVANIIILYIVFTVLYYVLFPYKITSILFILMGVLYSIINYYVSYFRNGNAILPSEIYAIETALNVSGNYHIDLNNQIPAVLFLVSIFIVVIVYLPNLSNRRNKKRVINGMLLIVMICMAYNQIDLKLYLNYWDISQSYSEYGTPLTFLTLCQNMSVDKPDGYSVEKAEDIFEEYNVKAVNQKEGIDESPTVIAIMNESFSDFDVIRDFETKPDYLSFWKSFEEPAVKGNLLVPVYGGGTCNTEFEFLTGLSMSNLPRGIYPYQMYDLSGVESLPRLFKKLGYDTLAIHPGKAASWNRAQAFSDLGFDDFISEENFNAEESDYLRGFISDAACYEKLIEAYENRKKEMFIFCVTIQNHGGYENITFDEDDLVSLEGDLNHYNDAREYLSLVRVSDNELKKLFDYFSNVNDPVVICVFGDHQPGLNGDFYDELYGKKSEYLTTEEKTEKYMTPYLIWANYDLGQEERFDTSANFLGSILLKKAGLPQDSLNMFLLEMQESIPMINPDYIKMANEKWLNLTEYQENEWIQNYSILQYYEMFGKGGN